MYIYMKEYIYVFIFKRKEGRERKKERNIDVREKR